MKQYIVDAFTDKPFSGNPAAVCVTDAPLPEEFMQKLAAENNLSETAFLVWEGDGCRLTGNGRIAIHGEAALVAVSEIIAKP